MAANMKMASAATSICMSAKPFPFSMMPRTMRMKWVSGSTSPIHCAQCGMLAEPGKPSLTAGNSAGRRRRDSHCFIDQTFEHEGGIKGGRVVPAALPYCLMEGLLCQTVQQMTGLALLEIEKKVLKPTFVGDTVHNEVEVVAIKPTSRGNRAVVTTVNNIVNQRGEAVITYKAVRMMAGRAPK